MIQAYLTVSGLTGVSCIQHRYQIETEHFEKHKYFMRFIKLNY